MILCVIVVLSIVVVALRMDLGLDGHVAAMLLLLLPVLLVVVLRLNPHLSLAMFIVGVHDGRGVVVVCDVGVFFGRLPVVLVV
jgi:hypothetical protein